MARTTMVPRSPYLYSGHPTHKYRFFATGRHSRIVFHYKHKQGPLGDHAYAMQTMPARPTEVNQNYANGRTSVVRMQPLPSRADGSQWVPYDVPQSLSSWLLIKEP
jgi:dipeptidase